MFWHQYQRTAPYIQLTIFVVFCILALIGVPWQQVLTIVVVMEAASFLGAAWAVRLKRKTSGPTLLTSHRSKY